jgi:7-cyano-7-deazaguanine synthase in queuosine biosynthesis
VLYTHKKFLRTVLLIVCLGDFYLNLIHTPLAQAQLNNWNKAHTCKQRAKIKLDNTYKAYSESDQQCKKCIKCCAKHNIYTKYYVRENSTKQLLWYMATTSTMLIYRVLDEITQAILLIIGGVL